MTDGMLVRELILDPKLKKFNMIDINFNFFFNFY